MNANPSIEKQPFQEVTLRKLDGLNRESIVAVAARCAWRVSPWLVSGWKDDRKLSEWMEIYLDHVRSGLVMALLKAKGGSIQGLDSADASDRFIHDAKAASEDAKTSGPASHVHRAVYTAFWTAFVVDRETNISPKAPEAMAAETAFSCALAFGGMEAENAMNRDIEALRDQSSVERLLDQPLWDQVPPELDEMWSEWKHVIVAVPEVGEFFELMRSVHFGKVDWIRLTDVFERWWSVNSELPSSSVESDSTARSAAATNKPKQKGPEHSARRIVETHLVSTKSVVGDREAEKLTPTAQRCMLALREFLVSDETHPPLTVAVEAPWGGGKSSLMRHLQDSLMNEPDAQTGKAPFNEEPIPTVWFNPWKHEAGKTLWAAFAVAFERQMAEGHGRWERLWKRVSLSVERLELMERVQLLFRLTFWIGTLIVLGSLAWGQVTAGTTPDSEKAAQGSQKVSDGDAQIDLKPKSAKPSEPQELTRPEDKSKGRAATPTKEEDWKDLLTESAPWWLGMIVTMWAFLKDAVKQLGSPLKLDVSRLLTHNDYVDQVDDLHRFHEDFRRLMRAYIPKRKNGQPGKVVVFIDDLDRCEAPKAADLLQSLHLMLNVQESSRSAADKDAPGVICVLGMDREKVAAAVAAKHEKLLPFLKLPEDGGQVSGKDAMDFGHEFLEKFIQLTLNLPSLQGQDLEEYLESITGASVIHLSSEPIPSVGNETSPREPATDAPLSQKTPPLAAEVVAAKEKVKAQKTKEAKERVEHVSQDLADGTVTLECARYVAAVLDNNPRKLKQFVNLFRLRLYLAAAMELLDLRSLHDAQSTKAVPRSASVDHLSAHHLAKLVALELAAPWAMARIRDLPSAEANKALAARFPKAEFPEINTLMQHGRPAPAYDLAKAPLGTYFHHFQG